MKNFRVWAMSAVAFLSVGWLQADTIPVDPTIKFTTGGHGSTYINCPASPLPCTGFFTTLAPPIGADGQANLDIFNNTGLDILAMAFFIPTTNFFQTFNVSTDAFTNAVIVDVESALGCRILSQNTVTTSCMVASFFGQGNVQAPPVNDVGEPDDFIPGAPPGFAAGQSVSLLVFTGQPPSGDPTFPGFLNHTHGTLALSVPEPSPFWVALTAVVGLLVARRRLTPGKPRT